MGRFILISAGIPFAMVAIIVVVVFGAGVRALSPSLVVLPAALLYCVGGALILAHIGRRSRLRLAALAGEESSNEL